MSRAPDLLFGLLALRLGYLTRDRLLFTVASWAVDPDASLSAAFASALSPAQAAAARAAVASHVDTHRTAESALATLHPEPEVVAGLAALFIPDDLKRALAALPHVPPPGNPEERYRLGAEIGRGGLGRVVEAKDGRLEREVAIKLVLSEAPASMAERFVREAKVTARLDHPNVVPVHDFGELAGAKGRSLFLCMKRIHGRDLGKLLQALACGEEAARRTYTRARLLGIFQDVCLAAAYAHSKGVIHRDLKPANVMIGDYGETLVVDWGLARVIGEAEPAAVRHSQMGAAKRAASSTLTMEGDILGTPQYMSPEQADGRLAETDARSDIWSLGAILFEILTGRPPFDGENAMDVIAQVIRGPVPVPSDVRPGIPPELDAIVGRAMAARKEDRYASALDLHHEVQMFLEGVREQERRQEEARQHVATGVERLRRYRDLREEIRGQQASVDELAGKLPQHLGLEEKKPLWEAEEKLEALRRERTDAFMEAEAAFGHALAAVPGLEAALEGKCELYADRYLAAEERRDKADAELQRKMLAQFDAGGRHRARLDAPGRAQLRAFAWECGCLRQVKGLKVEHAAEMTIPWRDGEPLPGAAPVPEDTLVPAFRLTGGVFGHAADCARREVKGARVTAARIEEREKRLQPGEERVLGTTPLDVELPQGTWRCRVEAPGLAPAIVLIRIERAAATSLDVSLFRPEEIPPGFCQVNAGPYIGGGTLVERGSLRPCRDVFVARLPVTAAEYLEFLNDLFRHGKAEEARARAPREGGRQFWVERKEGFRLPEKGADPRLDWEPEWPAVGMSWFDAMAYCAWRAARDGRPWSLMHEYEYEKAARGVDERAYAYGNIWDGSFSHSHVSLPKMSPRPVGSFPLDESPYGVNGLSGGATTWCLNSPPAPYRVWACVRGGMWSSSWRESQIFMRQGAAPNITRWHCGLRLALRPWRWPQT